MRACVRACVRACARACVRVCVFVKLDQFLPVRSHFDTKRPVIFFHIATFQSATFGRPIFAFVLYDKKSLKTRKCSESVSIGVIDERNAILQINH